MKKKIMITVLVTLIALIMFPVLYFAYCDRTYKGREDVTKVSYLTKVSHLQTIRT